MPEYEREQGLLVHLRKQVQSAAQFKAETGADDADIEELTRDYENLKFMIELCPLADEFKTTVFGAKRQLIFGEDGAAIGALMAAPAITPPHPLIAGISKRSRERDGRWKRSKTMTEAAMLGMDLVDSPDNLSPEQVKAVIEAVSAAAFGYAFALIVSGRGKSDLWEVQIRRKGQETWQTLGSATGKSADFTITASTPGQPEQIEVRVILKKGNQPYGQPSDPKYVTLNP